MKHLKDTINESIFDSDFADKTSTSIHQYSETVKLVEKFRKYMYEYITKKFHCSPYDSRGTYAVGLPLKNKRYPNGENLTFEKIDLSKSHNAARYDDQDMELMGNTVMRWVMTMPPNDKSSTILNFMLDLRSTVTTAIELFLRQHDKRGLLQYVKVGEYGRYVKLNSAKCVGNLPDNAILFKFKWDSYTRQFGFELRASSVA